MHNSMDLEKALRILAARYDYLKSCIGTPNRKKYHVAEALAIQTVVASAIINDELGMVPDKYLQTHVDNLLSSYSHLYTKDQKQLWKMLQKHKRQREKEEVQNGTSRTIPETLPKASS